MKRLAKAEKLHPYKIYYTENSGYYTLVDDKTKKGGKRKIRKAHKEDLLEELAVLYLDKKSKTLSEVYSMWIEWKTTPQNRSTIRRHEACWKTYYATEALSEDLIKKPMAEITSKELRDWAEALLKKHYPVNKQKFNRIFQIISDCYKFAADEDRNMVDDNLWLKAKDKINPALKTVSVTPTDESQIFTDEERIKIKEMVYLDLQKKGIKQSSAGLQVLFMFETALRIGECCGLKWSDIKGDRLYIQRQANNEGVYEWTKTTNGYRNIPLTKEALRILEDVKTYNEKYGYGREWIFQSDNENYDFRLSYDSANNKLAKLCRRLGTEKKSVHKVRKTALSALMDSPDISKRTVQRFAGHSDISTTQRYYSFERRTLEEQAIAIDKALSLESNKISK